MGHRRFARTGRPRLLREGGSGDHCPNRDSVIREALHLPVTRRVIIVRKTEWRNLRRTHKAARYLGLHWSLAAGHLAAPVGPHATPAFYVSPAGNFGLDEVASPRDGGSVLDRFLQSGRKLTS